MAPGSGYDESTIRPPTLLEVSVRGPVGVDLRIASRAPALFAGVAQW